MPQNQIRHAHTHKAPLSADAILDSFLAHHHQAPPTTKTAGLASAFTMPPIAGQHLQATQTKKKMNPNQQNLLFSISGRTSATPPGSQSGGEGEHQTTLQNTTTSNNLTSVERVKQKLLNFVCIYALIVFALCLTWVAFCYLQQSVLRRHQQQVFESVSSTTLSPDPIGPHSSSSLISGANEPNEQSPPTGQNPELPPGDALESMQSKFNDKLHLLERYIEVLALDLEDTKQRLKEREKCACAIGCSFNGTRYADGQRWNHQDNKCDICTCQAGRIACAPRECPKLTCEVSLQLPGQCCPSCMKSCKINRTTVRHGHTFRPAGGDEEPRKECKCYDGLIKCEPISAPPKLPRQRQAGARNRTLEYLKSILSSQQQQQQQIIRMPQRPN